MRSKTARPARPRLDRELIVDAAIERIEMHGIEELSARKLAQDLGCEAMSLYHHVTSMDALKDAIVDRLLGSIAAASGEGPHSALQQEAEAYLALARSRPRAFQLVATRRWKGKRSVETAGRAIAHLRALGFGEQQALARARTLGAYLNGAGLALAAWATDPEAPAEAAEAVATDLRNGLGLVLRSLAEPG